MEKCFKCKKNIDEDYSFRCVNCGALLCDKCIYLSDNVCSYCKSEIKKD